MGRTSESGSSQLLQQQQQHMPHQPTFTSHTSPPHVAHQLACPRTLLSAKRRRSLEPDSPVEDSPHAAAAQLSLQHTNPNKQVQMLAKQTQPPRTVSQQQQQQQPQWST